MAKNYNNDEDRGILRSAQSKKIDPSISHSEKLSKLDNRPKWLMYSFLFIAAVMLISFAIPEKYYHRNINILLLNIELLIVFGRDTFLYFKKSCDLVRTIMLLMITIYSVNIIDLLFNIPHVNYLTISLIIILSVLSVIQIVSFKK